MKSLSKIAVLAAATVAVGLLYVSPVQAHVTTEELVNADANRAEWLMYGRTYDNQRFSPLTEITPANVSEMTPVWAFSTGGKFAGLEGTPLFHDGVLYVSADYARVFAIDARTGMVKWRYVPEYDEGLDAVVCCGPSNRGLALLDDFVFVQLLDTRLVALNIADGTVAWEATMDDWRQGIASTGAPLVVKDHVIVGHAGGELGVRGHIRSFNAQTGALECRRAGGGCRRPPRLRALGGDAGAHAPSPGRGFRLENFQFGRNRPAPGPHRSKPSMGIRPPVWTRHRICTIYEHVFIYRCEDRIGGRSR